MMPDLRQPHDLRRVGVEHAVVVRLAVFREGLVHLRIGVEACGLEAGLNHPQSAEREDRPLERLVGLQADDHLVVAVDVAGLVRQQRRRRLGIDGEHALLALVLEIRLQLGPYSLGAFGRAREKLLVTGIGRGVADDEIPNVDRGAPRARLEPAPALRAIAGVRCNCDCRLCHIVLLLTMEKYRSRTKGARLTTRATAAAVCLRQRQFPMGYAGASRGRLNLRLLLEPEAVLFHAAGTHRVARLCAHVHAGCSRGVQLFLAGSICVRIRHLLGGLGRRRPRESNRGSGCNGNDQHIALAHYFLPAIRVDFRDCARMIATHLPSLASCYIGPLSCLTLPPTHSR